MKQRLFLIPGFGEDQQAFRQLAPYLADFELIYVDHRPVLDKILLFKMSSRRYAKHIAQHYGIRENDKIIGHSMGGYLAFQMREMFGNEICMIGAFSDPAKIIHLVPNLPLMTPIITASGFTKTEMARNYLQKKVAGKQIEQPLLEVLDNFKTFSNEQLFKLSLLTLEKKRESKLPNPLRIHAKDDSTIRYPYEPYEEVKGGHFCLNLYPEQVYQKMQVFLNQ